MKITDKAIEKLKPEATRVEYPDDLTPCLYLSLSPSGHRSWVVRYRIGGRTRK